MNKTELKTSTKNAPHLVDLVRDANAGDKQALAALRAELAGDNAKSLIEIAGNLVDSLEQSTLSAMLADQQAGTRLVLLEKLNQMRAELGWNSSPKLERILIERVCQTWLYLHWLEMADAQKKNRPMSLAKYESDRIEQAERRHLRAVKMLATVRKMALPIQIELKAEVNVTEKKPSTSDCARRFENVPSVN